MISNGDEMYPKTIFGWYNKLIRGHTYNQNTAYILDYYFNPSKRHLSTLIDRKPTLKLPKRKSN